MWHYSVLVDSNTKGNINKCFCYSKETNRCLSIIMFYNEERKSSISDLKSPNSQINVLLTLNTPEKNYFWNYKKNLYKNLDKVFVTCPWFSKMFSN